LDFYAYSTSSIEDEVTCQLKRNFSKWTDVSDLSDADAREVIYTDKVQILLDLSGHTSGNRLSIFSGSPAPVQVSWLGYPATTAVDQIDYILSDPYASRYVDEIFFTEKVWRLPSSSICFTPPAHNIDCGSVPATLSGFVTFGCFNNLAKINENVVSAWAKILESVPASRLYLKNVNLSDPGARHALLERFQRHGTPADRIILRPAVSSVADHLMEYNNIDIALDTFPYPGVTTSIESLWMGVPVLTIEGKGNLLRLGESIAHNINLPDWIAVDEDDYIKKAISFSQKLGMLAELRSSLRSRLIKSPLIDAKDYSRDFEKAMWDMWNEFDEGFEK
jgi:predicted O-linked N-acetylglucosamine transferase (SPINDLY family)